jgi:hypothetical protein
LIGQVFTKEGKSIVVGLQQLSSRQSLTAERKFGQRNCNNLANAAIPIAHSA